MYEQNIQMGIQGVFQLDGKIDKDTNLEAIQELNRIFMNLSQDLREGMQEATQYQISELIKKLEKDQPIDEDEKTLIRLWIVGDAHSCAKMENNYDDWLLEVQRIIDQVKELSAQGMTPGIMADLKGVSGDAIRTLSDIQFFKENLDRIQKFDQASEKMSTSDKKFLAGILKNELKWEKYNYPPPRPI